MKKLNIKINDNTYDVNVKSIDQGIAEVEVNGISYSVEFTESVDRKALVKQIKKSAAAASQPAQGQTAAPPPRAERKAATSAGALVAPMPGLILDIYVKQGDQVTDGQIVIKMEAMKMENEIPAPATGVVTEINVKKGDTVRDGDVMLVIGG